MTTTDDDAADRASRFRLAAAQPATTRGGYPGRAELASAVDALRHELADLARSRHAAARTAGADLAAEVVELLLRHAHRARNSHPRRPRVPSRAELDASVATARAAAAPKPAAAHHGEPTTPTDPYDLDLALEARAAEYADRLAALIAAEDNATTTGRPPGLSAPRRTT